MVNNSFAHFQNQLYSAYAPTHSRDDRNGARNLYDHPDQDSRNLPEPTVLSDCSWRDWGERGFTIGIGGPAGHGKTALVLALCKRFRNELNIAVARNDVSTRENGDFLITNALPSERIRSIETGGCPHVAIREDISANIGALETLQAEFGCQLLFVESGSINSDMNYSRELADYIIFVIDISTGDNTLHTAGFGISQSDLLVINKTNALPRSSPSLPIVECEFTTLRGNSPTIITGVKQGDVADVVAEHILGAWKVAGSPGKPGAVSGACRPMI